MKYQIFSFLFLLFSKCWGSQEENTLRYDLFNNYNKDVRPVSSFSKPVDVTIGLAVQNIESFNQIEETIQLNVWLRKYWKNDLLNWNSTEMSISQLTLDSDDIWTPDIELLNAATKPDIYTLKGGMYLYSDGNMLWSMPAVYKFSCALQLEDFPFDTQDCSLKFGSWTYDTSMLSLKPHGTSSTQIDVLDSFSHSEWELTNFYVSNYNETRECCGDRRFDINEYHFLLSRYTHYYKLNMGMTISLVIVSFIIMLVKPDNLSRTGTAVFIPLTILALQLTIADKIPVVGYYTLMDQFFLTCFITSMIVSIESGIVYTMITSKSDMIFKIFNNRFDFDKILQRIKDDKLARVHVEFEHEDFIKMKKHALFPIVNRKETESESKKIIETDVDSLRRRNVVTGSEDEFDLVANILKGTNEELHEERLEQKTPDIETQMDITQKRRKIIEDINKEIINDSTIVEKNVLKTIEFDNKTLSLTYKEFLLFNEVTRIFSLADNICRIILPIIFFIIIGVIFSYEN